MDGLIRQLVSVDDSHFGFVPSRGTTDAIFVVRQLQEKYLAAIKRLCMAFVDLESECVKSLLTPAKFRRVSMRRLSQWSGQQQHLLQRLQALGTQERQWVQVLDKGH